MQMSLQRQHFPLNYFKTLSDVPAELSSQPRTWQPDSQTTEPLVCITESVICLVWKGYQFFKEFSMHS